MNTTRVTDFVRSSIRAPNNRNSNVINLPLSPAQAKEKVLAHWNYLDRLSQQRFPYSSNMAHEGLLYIMEKLEQDEWKRVRTWQGQGRFSTYITTLSARLLTDFQRKKQGHIRCPGWIQEKHDPIWVCAHQLLIQEGISRQEAIHKLQTLFSDKGSDYIEEVIKSLISRCNTPPRSIEQATCHEEIHDTGSKRFAPENELSLNSEDLSALAWQLLQGDLDPDCAIFEGSLRDRLQELSQRLNPHLKLSEEDALLLRLRFVDGLSVKKIAQVMQLEGDPYKRLKNILKQLRRSFSDANIGDIE